MSIVAQPVALSLTIPLASLAKGMQERMALAAIITADSSTVACQAFAQADTDVNARLETWAAQLAIQNGGQ